MERSDSSRVLRNRTIDLNAKQEAASSNKSNKKNKKKDEPSFNILLQQERPFGKNIWQLVYILAIVLLFFWVFQTNFGFASSHSHSHDDGHSHDHEEPPSFKYSRQANEEVVIILEIIKNMILFKEIK